MSDTTSRHDVIRVPTVAPRDGTDDAARSAKDRRKLTRLGVVGIVLTIALGFLIFKAVTSAVVYFKTAQQAIQQRVQLGDSTFQVEGVVVKGTIQRDSAGTVTSFVISSGPTRLRISNSAPQPALFQPNVPVVLVGHFVAQSNTFASDQILVKHSNAYIASHPNRVRAPNGSVR